MKTTLELPDDVVDLLRRESARRGGRRKASLSSLVSHAVREVFTGEACMPAPVDLKGGRVVVKRDEAILRLHHHNLWAPSAATNASAVTAMRRAVADKPGFAIGWAALAELRMDRYAMFDPLDTLEEAQAAAQGYLDTAISLDPTVGYFWWVQGLIHVSGGDPEKVVGAAERILELESDPGTTALCGWLLAVAGKWERGLGLLEAQMALGRQFPGWWHHPFFLDAMRRDDFNTALRHARQFLHGNPQYFWPELECAAALGALGRKKSASAALKRVEKLRPGFCKTPIRFLRCYIMQDEIVDAVMQGLKAAGLDDAAKTGSKRSTAETSHTTAQ